MSTALSLEARDRLHDYLSDHVPLSELRRWLRLHALSVVEDTGDADDEDLLYKIELLLSELEAGEWTEQEVRQALASLNPSDQMKVSSHSASQ